MARDVAVSISHIIITLKAMRLTECSWHQRVKSRALGLSAGRRLTAEEPTKETERLFRQIETHEYGKELEMHILQEEC